MASDISKNDPSGVYVSSRAGDSGSPLIVEGKGVVGITSQGFIKEVKIKDQTILFKQSELLITIL